MRSAPLRSPAVVHFPALAELVADFRDRLILFRVKTGEFNAQARFEADRAADERLQREKAELRVAAVGEILLVAANARVLVEILDAALPGPAASIALHQVGAHFPAVREEAGADGAVFLELVMVVFGDARRGIRTGLKNPLKGTSARTSPRS